MTAIPEREPNFRFEFDFRCVWNMFALTRYELMESILHSYSVLCA